MKTKEVAVVGGGIAGLMSAWFLAKSGCRVALFEKNTIGSGTTQFAAGMLAPVSEIEFSELDLLRAGLESRRLYDALEEELGEIGLIRAGTLEIGLHAEDEGYLRRSFDFQRQQGLDVQWLDSAGIRALEPFVSPQVPCGIVSPGDIQIDHFVLLKVLVERLAVMGVELHEQEAVEKLETRAGGGMELITTQRSGIFDKVVMATGVFGGGEMQPPYQIYPVRGEVMSLVPPKEDFLRYTVRIRSRILGNAYVVPKKDCIILGTTSEEKGYGQANTLGGILGIARKCYAAVPGLYELDIASIGAGLRPASIDRNPIIGKEPHREVYQANGLYRHGILLGPLVGKAIAELVESGRRLPWIEPFGLPA